MIDIAINTNADIVIGNEQKVFSIDEKKKVEEKGQYRKFTVENALNHYSVKHYVWGEFIEKRFWMEYGLMKR